MTEEEKTENEGKDTRIDVYDESGNVSETYYVEKEYTVYGGAKDTDCDSANITVESGTLAKIVLGGKNGNVDQVANLYVYGGHVDDIIVNENGRVGYADGHSGYAYIFVSDAEVGNITVGGQNGKTGSFSQLVLDCSNMTSYANLTMGYCDGMLLSDRLNDEDSTIIMSVTIFGEKLNGIDAFKELPYCTVNNESIVKFHAGKGEFDNGDKIYNYTTSLFDEEGNPLYID